MKIIVFASGSGSNFINIYNNTLNSKIKGKIVLLVSNNSNCGAIKFAKNNNVNHIVINKFRFKNQENINKKYEMVLELHQPDLILLAGFMKKIPQNIIKKFKNKIVNIHPSLLPRFGGRGYYGKYVHKAVLRSKDKFTGVTVHYVNNEYDKGDIIHQEKIKVNENDSVESLASRVLKVEHEIYSKVVQMLCEKNKL